MTDYTVAIIGTGPDPTDPSVDGFAMGYRHAEAYTADDRFSVTACVDIVPENAAVFGEEFDIPESNLFEEYTVMLDTLAPDVVSVTVPPAVHESVVVDCTQHSAVRAIHCEKPIADTWGAAQRMVQTAWRHDVQLTFNRQRRFAKPFTTAKELLDQGEIGGLERIEIGWGDFFDTGAHTIDLAGMMNDERPVDWVIAQLDYREEDIRFGTHQENQMLAHWEYDNGVSGLLSTGSTSDLVDATMVLRGTNGALRIAPEDGPMLERVDEDSRESVPVDDEGIHATGNEPEGRFGSLLHNRSIAHLGDSLSDGTEPIISGRRGLNTAEIIFAGYQSVKQRGRIDLPLEPSENALEQMVSSGSLSPMAPETEDS